MNKKYECKVNFTDINTFKYHIFAPMGRFQLELIYLYFPPSSHLIYVCFCPVGLSLLINSPGQATNKIKIQNFKNQQLQ